MESSTTEYVLHPGMMDRALGAGRKVMEGEGEGETSSWKVGGVEKVRIGLRRGGVKMLARARESGGERKQCGEAGRGSLRAGMRGDARSELGGEGATREKGRRGWRRRKQRPRTKQ